MKAGGNSKIDCSRSSSSIFGLGCFADYRLSLATNKVRCGSSLARCRRIAVAPTYGEQQATVEALSAYLVTGLITTTGMAVVATVEFYSE